MREGWTETTLGKVAKCAGGSAFPIVHQNSQIGIPFIKVSDMNIRGNEVEIISALNHITSELAKKLKVRVWPKDTVIFPKVGAALLTDKRRILTRDTIFDNNIMGLIACDIIIPRFLFLFMTRIRMSDYVQSGALPSISNGIVQEIEINLPPLQEQKRIVDLISSVDTYIDALQQQADCARKSRNAVLHEMLSAGGDGWIYTTIGGVAEFINTRRSPAELSPQDIYVGLEHLQPHDQSISTFGSVSQVSSSLTPFIAENILFGRLRPYLHKVAFAEFSGYCSPEILVMSAKNDCIPRFLGFVCGLDSTISACVEMSAGTRMPRTSVGDLSSINFNLPPKFRQQEIVDLISSVDNSIFAAEVTIAETKKLRSALLADLLSGKHEIPASYDKITGAG